MVSQNNNSSLMYLAGSAPRQLIGYEKYSLGEIKNDINIRGSVERYLYLVSRATIDLAEAVIAYKKFRKPTTMSECFHILFDEKIIFERLRDKLVGMVGFRNIMALDYDDVDYEIVYELIHEGVKDLAEFTKIIEGIIQ